MIRFPKPDRYLIPAYILFMVYCLLFSVLSILKFRAFNCDLDLGNILQAFHNTLHGRFMEMTWNGADFNMCRWRGHTEMFFVFLLPFYWVIPSAATLLVLQTVAIGAGGLIVFALADHLTGDRRIALAMAITYWVFPLLASINLSDFHADPFMIPFHLLAWLCLRKRMFGAFWVAIIIASLVKEYAAILNVLIGMMILRSHRRTSIALLIVSFMQIGVLTPAIRMISGASAFSIDQPHVTGKTANAFALVTRLAQRLTANLGAFPGRVIALLAVLMNATIVMFPAGLIMVVPLSLLLASVGSFQVHRHAILIAPILILLVEGVARMPQRVRFRYAVFGILVPTVAAFLFFPGTRVATHVAEMLIRPRSRNVFHYRITFHDQLADSLIARIPADIPIASDTHLRTRLARREWAFVHPYPTDRLRSEYYLFDFFEKLDSKNEHQRKKRAAELLSDSAFVLASHVDGLLVLKRSEDRVSLKPFTIRYLQQTDSVQEFKILESSIREHSDGFVMKTIFSKGSHFKAGDALISFFISQNDDTVRVLHLASYLSGPISQLKNGVHEEEFFFQVPSGVSIDTWKHEICLYRKWVYLPFFARLQFRIACMPSGIQQTQTPIFPVR